MISKLLFPDKDLVVVIIIVEEVVEEMVEVEEGVVD